MKQTPQLPCDEHMPYVHPGCTLVELAPRSLCNTSPVETERGTSDFGGGEELNF